MDKITTIFSILIISNNLLEQDFIGLQDGQGFDRFDKDKLAKKSVIYWNLLRGENGNLFLT